MPDQRSRCPRVASPEPRVPPSTRCHRRAGPLRRAPRRTAPPSRWGRSCLRHAGPGARRSPRADPRRQTPSAAAARTMASTPAAFVFWMSSRYFSTQPRVCSTSVSVSSCSPSSASARTQSIVWPTRGCEVELPQRADGGSDLPGQPLARLGHAQPHYGHFPVDVGVIDPVVQAASFEGVMQIAGAIGG